MQNGTQMIKEMKVQSRVGQRGKVPVLQRLLVARTSCEFSGAKSPGTRRAEVSREIRFDPEN